MSIIIIEGCDCVGKSTLAELLSERTGYEIVKGSSFEIASLGTDAMYEHMMGLLDRNDIIIDRFFMSNYVYGNLYGYPTMSNNQLIDLADKASDNALTVYVTANELTIKHRMSQRGDDMIKANEIGKILEKYKEAIDKPILAQKLLLQLNTSYINNMSMTASMIKSIIVDTDETSIFIKNDK